MSRSDPHSPAEQPDFPGGKGDLHIPGAGTMGMFVLILSLSMLFWLASMVAVCGPAIAGSGTAMAASRPECHLPATLWLSTVLLLSCSATIHWAWSGIRKDRESRLIVGLAITLVLGLAFLAAQCYNWYDIWLAISADQHRSKFLTTFYMLTGLHAAHVLGGLIPLAVVLAKARRHVYSRNFHPGVRYCASCTGISWTLPGWPSSFPCLPAPDADCRFLNYALRFTIYRSPGALLILLKTTNLVKIYGGRTVVNNVSFEVGNREVVGLLGRNGAGKTTTFRMVMGMITPDDGQVMFDGFDITEHPHVPALRQKHGLSLAGTIHFPAHDGRTKPDRHSGNHAAQLRGAVRRSHAPHGAVRPHEEPKTKSHDSLRRRTPQAGDRPRSPWSPTPR